MIGIGKKLAQRLSFIFLIVLLFGGGSTQRKRFALKSLLVDNSFVNVTALKDEVIRNATNTVVNSDSLNNISDATNLNATNGAVPRVSFDINYDAFNTPQTQCRHELELWQNNNYDKWIPENEPWVEWVWELTEENGHQTREPYYYVALIISVNLCKKNCAVELKALKWYWQDQYGNNFTASNYNTGGGVRFYLRMDSPVYAEKWDLHEDGDSGRVVNRTFSKTQQNIERSEGRSVPAFIWSEATWSKAANRTKSFRYDIRPYFKCNQIEKMSPPPSDTKIGACVVRFWGQHDLMAEWLEYHRMIGIQHFWLFVSEDFDNFVLKSNLPRHAPDITYIPYNYRWYDHMHLRPEAKVGYKGEALFQPSGNNQCLYIAKTYNLDWIVTPDVDEFIAVEDPVSNESFPLRSALQKIEQKHGKSVGSFCMPSSAYQRNVLTESRTDPFELTIDFTYRWNKTLGDNNGRRKCFYKPWIVRDVEVHTRIIGGRQVMMSQGINLHHYRTPLEGHRDSSKLASYPYLRDTYREKILAALRRSNATLPNFKLHDGKHRNQDKVSQK